VLEVVVERDHRRLVREDDPEQDDREDDPVAEEAHSPERVAGADREHGRHGGDGPGDDEAGLEPGPEPALRPGGTEAGQIRMRRPGEAGDEVRLLVQREEEDRQDRIDRGDRERGQDQVAAVPLEPPRGHACSLRSPTRRTIAASTKIASARMVATAAAYPTLLNRKAFWYMYSEGTTVSFPGPPDVVL